MPYRDGRLVNWASKVRVKHLFTEDEDWESIQKSMTAIADVLDGSSAFMLFTLTDKFRNIPKGDDIFKPVDYANRLLAAMYDFADENLIWIE